LSPGPAAEVFWAGVVAIATSGSMTVNSSLRDKSRYGKRGL
jgi:hypothetical protein